MTPFKPAYAVFIALAVVLLGGGAFLYLKNTTPAAPIDTTVPADSGIDAGPADTVSTTTDTSSNTSGYKDGTYSATGSYRTPETTEQLNVTLTLKDGIVTAAEVTGDPQAPETVRFQGQFIANYKAQVIGKSIATLSLSHVSGSSLTSSGFNAAVAKIKTQAQS